jgi:2-polyprenyl-3-methyl-5-hydroxy-6-metoxy-1,4-benzoquinol methylase
MNKFDIKSYLAGHKTEVRGERGYENYTINSNNPLARFSHRTRIKKSIAYILPRLELGNVLDYGCGTGVILSILNKIKSNSTIGYEPFHTEKFERNSPVYSNFDDVLKFAPYKTVIVFEVLEHLSISSTDEFLSRCDELLGGGGGG